MAGLLVWIVCVTFFFYEYFLRTVVGTFQYSIGEMLQLDVLKFALVSSTAYSIVFGLTQIPIGVLIDKYGLRSMLIFGILTCALGSVFFGLSNNFTSAVASRVLMGFGSAFGYLCVLAAIYEWLPRRNAGLFIGLSQGLGTFGPILAAGPMMTLSQTQAASWREIFFILGVVGIFIALFAAWSLTPSRSPKPYKDTSKQLMGDWRDVLKSLKAVIQHRHAWMIGLFCGCNYFTIEYMAQNNGHAFLMLKGFSDTAASYVISLGWIGFGLGCPLIGWISDRSGTRHTALIIATIVCMAFTSIFIYSNILWCVGLSFLGIGFCCGAQTLGYAVAAENAAPKQRAVAMGVVNATVALVMAVASPLIGWILRKQQQVGPLKVEDYQQAFWIILGLLATSLAVLIMEHKSERRIEAYA